MGRVLKKNERHYLPPFLWKEKERDTEREETERKGRDDETGRGRGEKKNCSGTFIERYFIPLSLSFSLYFFFLVILQSRIIHPYFWLFGSLSFTYLPTRYKQSQSCCLDFLFYRRPSLMYNCIGVLIDRDRHFPSSCWIWMLESIIWLNQKSSLHSFFLLNWVSTCV